jgi:hypothetical protein
VTKNVAGLFCQNRFEYNGGISYFKLSINLRNARKLTYNYLLNMEESTELVKYKHFLGYAQMATLIHSI